mgnify:CR=1 FL=1|jgi:hypothetical protein
MKFVDTVVATIPLNKGEGFIPKDLHKIGVSKIKKMLALEVDHNGLKALKVDYIKIVKKDLSSVNFDDQGNIIGSPILTVNLIGTNDFVDFKNADIGSCFSFKFYDSALWGEEKPFYFEDYNGKTDLLRKFSNKSREAILIDLQKEVEAGKVIML